MIGIFLDDERLPVDVSWIKYPDNVQWIVVRSYKEFMHALLIPIKGRIVSFDHDLQCFEKGIEKTGYDCLKLMCDMDDISSLDIKGVYFHTKNPIGLDNMESYWDNYLKYKQTSEL